MFLLVCGVSILCPVTNFTLFSAEPTNSRKKKQLTELEIALKREETARKRKNLSEKKLEDEKVCFLRLPVDE